MIITKLQVAPVELVVSSESSCAVRLARHSQNAWARQVEPVESCRVESRRAKWNLGYTQPIMLSTCSCSQWTRLAFRKNTEISGSWHACILGCMFRHHFVQNHAFGKNTGNSGRTSVCIRQRTSPCWRYTCCSSVTS